MMVGRLDMLCLLLTGFLFIDDRRLLALLGEPLFFPAIGSGIAGTPVIIIRQRAVEFVYTPQFTDRLGVSVHAQVHEWIDFAIVNHEPGRILAAVLSPGVP